VGYAKAMCWFPTVAGPFVAKPISVAGLSTSPVSESPSSCCVMAEKKLFSLLTTNIKRILSSVKRDTHRNREAHI
jgi:hypothetical protein